MFTPINLTHAIIIAPSNRYDHNVLKRGLMINEVSAVAFRQNLGQMINQVQYRHDSLLIKKDGKPGAALVDAQLFEHIRRFNNLFDTLSQEITSAFADVHEEEGMAEVDALVTEIRYGNTGA
jgi:prevent-host-death family protein